MGRLMCLPLQLLQATVMQQGEDLTEARDALATAKAELETLQWAWRQLTDVQGTVTKVDLPEGASHAKCREAVDMLFRQVGEGGSGPLPLHKGRQAGSCTSCCMDAYPSSSAYLGLLGQQHAPQKCHKGYKACYCCAQVWKERMTRQKAEARLEQQSLSRRNTTMSEGAGGDEAMQSLQAEVEAADSLSVQLQKAKVGTLHAFGKLDCKGRAVYGGLVRCLYLWNALEVF